MLLARGFAVSAVRDECTGKCTALDVAMALFDRPRATRFVAATTVQHEDPTYGPLLGPDFGSEGWGFESSRAHLRYLPEGGWPA